MAPYRLGRERLAAFALASLLAFLPNIGLAKCEPNEVLVGEDDKFYYCKDRVEYANCIRETGETWKKDRVACAYRVERCVKDDGYVLTAAATSCVVGCIKGALRMDACLASCGVAAIIPVRTVERCGIDLGNICLEEALVRQKQNQEACKH